MASNPLRMRNNSGRDIDILCGAATDEPVSPRTVIPSFNAIHINIPERRRVGNLLPPWQPHDLALPLRQRSPASHRSPIQLPPLRPFAVEMRRHRTDYDMSRNNTVADYAHEPFSAPYTRDPLSSSPLSALARDKDMMRPRHSCQTFPLTPKLRCSSGDSIHAHHYHKQHYTVSPGHMVSRIPRLPPPPATTVTASGTKSYHCCYANVVGCKKTFTTSGHASRHSKIHTCEKGIQCTFPRCPKKFTRADNMKQHLETHFTDPHRPRPSSSGAGSSCRRARATLQRQRVGEARGLTRDMVKLRPRQIQEVNTKEGNEALA